MITVKGNVVGVEQAGKGAITLENGRIAQVAGTGGAKGKTLDFGDCWIVPGFVDTHTHGIGVHRMLGLDGLVGAAQVEPSFGVTSFLPSAGCLAEAGYVQFGDDVRVAQTLVQERGARILGCHFEGPFINPASRGGMELEYLRAMDGAECGRYIAAAGDVLKLMTLSPELDGGDEIIRLLRARGIVVSLGHSAAELADLTRALDAGVTHVCHLFNTFKKREMTGWQWEPGLLEHILVSDRLSCEVICDLQHVLPTYVQLAAKVLGPDRFVAITDGVQGAGLEPGEYQLHDGQEFSSRTGVARLVSDESEVVGSVLSMNRAFGNLIDACGMSVVVAARFTATNAARVLGLERELGSIEVGKRADIAVIDKDFECVVTFVDGKCVYGD